MKKINFGFLVVLIAILFLFAIRSNGNTSQQTNKISKPLKIAVIGHLYGTYDYKNGDGFFSGSALEKFVEVINRNNYDYVVVTGDIVRTKKIQNFDVISKFISKLKVKGVYFTPGNHDLEFELLIENYSKKIGYLNKNFAIPGTNIVLNMINSSGSKEQSLKRLPTGFSLENNAKNLIKNLNKNKINVLFMHHHIYWDHAKFDFFARPAWSKISRENMKLWERDIMPMLVEKNVKLVISGDPTCCIYKSTGMVNDVALLFLKNDILHVNASTKWNVDEINYLELLLREDEKAMFFKAIKLK